MIPSKPKYKVIIFLTEDIRHTSYVVKGLLDLEKTGFISLDFRSMPMLFNNRIKIQNSRFIRTIKGYPWCPELVITSIKKKTKKRVGIDLQDWDNYFSHHSFQNCSIVFKRALTEKNKLFLEKEKPNFVKPFGPNFYLTVTDKRYLKNIKISKIKQTIAKVISNPSKIPNKIKEKFIETSKNIRGNGSRIVSENAFRYPPNKRYIFFQVQYYDWKNKHSKSINDYRASIIRTLKNSFKEQFYGGMWFVHDVHQDYKDCVTNVDTNKKTYDSFIEKASVVISTNGFGESIPWKLIEFLKSGSCIVTERNKHLFREPLTNNEVTFYNNKDEIINSCRELLKDKKLNKLKRKNAFKYYEKYLNPQSSMKEVIESSFS